MKTRKQFNLMPLTSVIIIAMFFIFGYGCTGESADQTENEENTDTVAVSEIVQEEKKILEYPLPTPFEITQMLNNAGAGYILDILNPTENIDKYETRTAKALNLGVYGADLSYASTYNKTEEVAKYVESAKNLTEDLGISGSLNENILKRIDNNIDNKDSLYQIITKTFYDTFDYLNDNKQGKTSVLILAGGWIEGLYISTQLAETAQKKDEVVKGISEQKATLATLLNTMKQYKEEDDVAQVIEKLKKIEDIYKTMDGDMLTNKQVKEISGVIEEIRNNIIG